MSEKKQYQQEVKKVYPNAFCKRMHDIDSNFLFAVFKNKPWGAMNMLSRDFDHNRYSIDAWKSAYENLSHP